MNRFDYRLVRQLSLLSTVVDAGSVSKAAENLAISVPPIVVQLNELETRLGVRFLNRTKRGISLTPEGRAVLPSIRRMVSQVEAVDYAMRLVQTGTVGIVKIGAVLEAMNFYLPPVIRRLKATQPGITIFTEQISSSEAERKLTSGEMDIAIGTFGTFSCKSVESRVWKSEAPLVVVPSDSELRDQTSVHLCDLSQENWILIGNEQSPEFRRQTDCLFRKAGITPKVSHTVESIVRATAFVACGQGIALIPASYEAMLPPTVIGLKVRKVPAVMKIEFAWSSELENPLRDAVLNELQHDADGEDTGKAVTS